MRFDLEKGIQKFMQMSGDGNFEKKSPIFSLIYNYGKPKGFKVKEY